MKKLTSVLFLMCLAKFGFAQAVAGRVDYQKSSQPATIIELPYNPALVSAALKDHFAKKNVKETPAKGFSVYRGVQLTAADPTPSDMYFKIDPKSRREDNMSVVYVVVTKPGENPATRSSDDNYGMEQAKSFLNEIGPAIDAYNLSKNIQGQDDAIKKAEKKLSSLVDDGRELEKRKRNLEEKIQENMRDQENQRMEIEKQRQALQTLNSKKTIY
jgi:hypothetical protein